jgi:hypothetical protein
MAGQKRKTRRLRRVRSQRGGMREHINPSDTPEITGPGSMTEYMNFFGVSAHGNIIEDRLMVVPPNTWILHSCEATTESPAYWEKLKSWLFEDAESSGTIPWADLIYSTIYPGVEQPETEGMRCRAGRLLYEPGDILFDQSLEFKNNEVFFKPRGILKLPLASDSQWGQFWPSEEALFGLSEAPGNYPATLKEFYDKGFITEEEIRWIWNDEDEKKGATEEEWNDYLGTMVEFVKRGTMDSDFFTAKVPQKIITLLDSKVSEAKELLFPGTKKYPVSALLKKFQTLNDKPYTFIFLPTCRTTTQSTLSKRLARRPSLVGASCSPQTGLSKINISSLFTRLPPEGTFEETEHSKVLMKTLRNFRNTGLLSIVDVGDIINLIELVLEEGDDVSLATRAYVGELETFFRPLRDAILESATGAASAASAGAILRQSRGVLNNPFKTSVNRQANAQREAQINRTEQELQLLQARIDEAMILTTGEETINDNREIDITLADVDEFYSTMADEEIELSGRAEELWNHIQEQSMEISALQRFEGELERARLKLGQIKKLKFPKKASEAESLLDGFNIKIIASQFTHYPNWVAKFEKEKAATETEIQQIIIEGLAEAAGANSNNEGHRRRRSRRARRARRTTRK